jgi:hypothetical protein
MGRVVVAVVLDYFVLRIFGETKDVVRWGTERRILPVFWEALKDVVAKRTSNSQHRVKMGVIHWHL